ncbi:hypothetical protein [Halorubrum vacuolatum]|uniref:DUF8054 domain-containing protein n=1 Tax=Halorubrum vacuolatum TaxID=63740 RepID=A0A238W8I3_HALVU|nr:hypothetical protein [Halorubrum vacuolatum]SNR42701.1 hypothetical protein SAMN06264855_10623 [Halorubrum vacuolatum]
MTDGSDPPELYIPRGTLLRSRVVSDIATTLETALDRSLTGYSTIVPQETLLLSGEAKGVITFEDGVPMLAYNTVTDNGGPAALAELAVPGPYRVELYAVDGAALETAHEADALRIPPGSVATELADAPDLAARTRAAAPEDRHVGEGHEETDALASFLADDDRIEALREQAREEARARAAEWGLTDVLDDEGSTEPTGASDGRNATSVGSSEPF